MSWSQSVWLILLWLSARVSDKTRVARSPSMPLCCVCRHPHDSSSCVCCASWTHLNENAAAMLGAWPRHTKELIAALKPGRNGPVGSNLAVSWVPLHFWCWDHISPTEQLFICFLNLIILAGWRYDWWWSNIPTQVDAERALTHVCTPITATHTNEHGWPWRSEPMELPSAPIKGCWLLPACHNSYKSAQVFTNYLHLWSFLTQAAHTISTGGDINASVLHSQPACKPNCDTWSTRPHRT